VRPATVHRASGNGRSVSRGRPAPAPLRSELELGEDITETLEVIPRRWKVIQTVREKFSCRECEKITQTPSPFHVTPRGFAGPNLLAMILFENFGQHPAVEPTE